MALAYTLNSCPRPVYGTIRVIARCSRGAEVRGLVWRQLQPQSGLPAVLVSLRSPDGSANRDCPRRADLSQLMLPHMLSMSCVDDHARVT